MEHGIEVLLQIDPFGEAVGADQHEPSRLLDERLDACLSLRRWEPASDRFHGRSPQHFAQMVRYVLRGIDEAAKHDRMEGLDLADGTLQLAVRGMVDTLGAARELQQTTAHRLRPVFDVRAWAEVQCHRIIVIGLVEHRAAAYVIHLVLFGLVGSRTTVSR